ncbi:flavin reductase family protein [Roseovarius pelagicus]|uniref:Flavin reductase family protein n=1 Tax=Roseovarius pelagicus TaxID=2980108 RepID=A0ABY6D7X4_9RHOB|nr:flavin reductase family protein [Roseovarius pelagicus]UXX82242.1 flavin reductase family protein [Roseovarius pelagicus]
MADTEPVPMAEADKRALRDAFGSFATGVTVLTTVQEDGTPRGFTANSFTSVSLDPPLLLICVAKTAHSCCTFCSAPYFAVNILSEDQRDVSGLFASRAPDKFDQVDWHSGPEGVPILPASLCSFVCTHHAQMDAGDHVVVVGRVISFEMRGGAPLGYHRGSYFSIGLEDRLANAAAGQGGMRIGAIMEKDGALLLCRHAAGHVSVPVAPVGAGSLSGLVGHLGDLGLSAQLDHLYSVYEDARHGQHAIIYHGTVEGSAPEGMVYLPLEDIPLDDVQSAPERSMLARYRQEYKHGQFGIYQGDAEQGTVHAATAAGKTAR